MTLRDLIEEVLTAHHYFRMRGRCTCGWSGSVTTHRSHLADALVAAVALRIPVGRVPWQSRLAAARKEDPS